MRISSRTGEVVILMAIFLLLILSVWNDNSCAAMTSNQRPFRCAPFLIPG
jgi:hypothetical protein